MDRWGVPHITARSIEDAFIGQGYTAATLRLWQMDLGRRRGLGQLAAVMGPAFVPFDHAARQVLYRGDVAADWKLYDPRVPKIAAAFVRGINARVAQVRADPALLPPEFTALGFLPDLWAADDLIRIRYLGAPNIRGEMRRALLACRGVLDLDALLVPLQPPRKLVVPVGLDPCLLQRDQLALYDRLSAPLPFAQATHASALGAAGAQVALASDVDARNGSNAWVVAPPFSATGRTILANDPHLAFSVPGQRIIMHLKAPGLDAIGAGPAGRPGMQFGHNSSIAFGRTDFQIDQEDLVLLRMDAGAQHYATSKGPAAIEWVHEAITVRGGSAVTVELGFCNEGPVLFADKASGHALALRAVWLQPGAAAALEYVPPLFATDWTSFRASLRAAVWGTNYMYADIDGNIGWQSAGRVPVRPNHDGLLPVPADGDYPWTGILPIADMPGAANPPGGWIASANQMPFPAGFPAEQRNISFEWLADDRYRRIAAVLDGQTHHGLADSNALQLDVQSGRAAALVALLNRVTDPALAAERSLLQHWDQRIDAGSAAAALFSFWWSELGPAVAHSLVPKQHQDLLPSVHPHVMLAMLQQPGTDSLLADALARASAALRTRLGPDMAAWQWGRLHQVDLRHPVGRLMPGQTADVLGGASGGDGATVMARWWASAARPQVTGGAAFRAVIDVGNWDASRVINSPGQSGDPRNPHYADLYQPWLAGETFPLLYSPHAIADAAESRLTLEPGP